jgi:phospholipase/carboxylesterase
MKSMEPMLHSLEVRADAPGHTKAALLLLHGLGANETAVMGLARGLDSRFQVLSLRAPIAMGTDSSCWFPVRHGRRGPEIDREVALQSRLALLRFIGNYKAIYTDRPIFLMAFSQGATMAISTLLTSPGHIAGVVSLSGRFPDELASELADAQELRSARAWIGHGKADTVLSFSYAQSLDTLLSKLGVEHEFRQYDSGHVVSAEMLRDAQSWLRERIEAPTLV